jgi:hypothetical protein
MLLPLSLWERVDPAHRTGGYAGRRDGLNSVEKRQVPYHCQESSHNSSAVHPVTRRYTDDNFNPTTVIFDLCRTSIHYGPVRYSTDVEQASTKAQRDIRLMSNKHPLRPSAIFD